GADDHRVGRSNDRAVTLHELADRAIEFEAAEARARRIAMLCIPRHVALEERHLMAELVEALEQGPIGGGVAVSPGGAEGQSEKDEHHAAASLRLPARRLRNN